MLRQSPSRNQRSKGFKLKSVVQICVLVVISIWLLYQVKHYLDKKKAYKGSANLSVKAGTRHEIIRLGRKGLRPEVEERGAKNEELGEGREDQEEEEEENGEEARGAGDDEMDGRDQDRLEEEESEQAEDFGDEEDQDMMEEGSER